MKQRGRKSGSSFEQAQVIEFPQIPEPPSDLTPKQAAVWTSVMRSRAADLIPPECYPVVKAYCRAVVMADEIAAEVEHYRSTGDDNKWRQLLTLSRGNTALLTSLATKLRLTPSTRASAGKAGRNAEKGEKRRPWEG